MSAATCGPLNIAASAVDVATAADVEIAAAADGC